MDVDSLEENKQLFFQSCKDGSLATVQQLLTHSDLRAHLDSLTDDGGNTALIVASENGHKGIVKLLLECGVNVDKRTPNGWTALMKASERGDSNLEVIDLLLRHGAQADLQNNEGDSALIVATQNRQTVLVIKLVRDHRANVDLKNKKGWTALMKASQVGCVEMVELLLNHGAQVDQQNSNGETTLMIASQNGHIKIVKLLLKFRAKVDIKANDSKTALVLANQQKHLEAVELLLEYGAKDNLDIALACVAAIKEVHINTIKLLLEHGAKPDYRLFLTPSALKGASGNGRVDIVKLLLDNGSHEYLGLPMTIASRNGHIDVVKELLDRGSCSEADLGWTLVEAILNKHNDITELLLKYGARVDHNFWFSVPDQSPLVKAVGKGDADIVKLLLEHGAKQEMGLAITKAILNERAEIIQLLSEHGAQVDDDQFELGMFDEPPLVTASINGNTYIVKLLLQHGAKRYLGWALTEAILNRHNDTVHVLVEHGAKVDNERDYYFVEQDPALLQAVVNGHNDSVKLLLKHGANQYLGDALAEAIFRKNIEIVKVLLEYSALEDRDDWLDPPLVIASETGDTNIVKLLLDQDRAKEYLNSALAVASREGHSEIIKLLLENGANIDDANALVEASENGHTDVVQLLSIHGSSQHLPALIAASQRGHNEIIKILLEAGVKVNGVHTTVYGEQCALMSASKNGHIETVELLLQHGADINLKNKRGLSALMLASQNGHIKITELLLEHGAQVNLQDTDGLSALMLASKKGDTEAVKLLLQKGAQVNLQNNDGHSALMLACENGHIDITKQLLQHGSQINMQNYDGWSALMLASHNGHNEVVKLLLLQFNVDVNLQRKNDGGYCALIAASENGHADVVKLLLQTVHGGIQEGIGMNALEAASYNGHIDVVKLLLDNLTDAAIYNATIRGHSSVARLLQDTLEQKLLAAVELAIKNGGKINHLLLHGVFVGPPRSGKDSFMKRLMGEMPSDTSPSTGAAEQVVHVIVEKSFTTAATIEDSKWIRLKYDEEAIQLIKTASSKNVAVINKQSCANLTDPETDSSMLDEGRSNSEQQNQGSNALNVSEIFEEQSSIPHPTSKMYSLEPEVVQEMSVQRKHKTPMEIFKEAIKNEGMEDLKKHLADRQLLYLTNTGGQMEFQELLPLLVSGPSVFFITFQLHKSITETFSVVYELPSGELSKSYQSSLNVLETILQILSSIAAMGTYVYKGLQRKAVPLQPKVFIIGTHKDMLDKKSADTVIKSIDKHLQKVIRSTSHYREELIQCASESQMIFAVNNHDPDDKDFQRIRSAVENLAGTADYQMRSPAHWMVFSLVLRQLQNRVEHYNKCYQIAKECGIKDEKEFNEALHFIHTRMGLIRYFPHEELKDLVIIDPQILFEKVTELIVETFTFKHFGNLSKPEIFKNMGIFNLIDFERISSRTGQNLTPTLFAKLLEHLRIAAPFQQDGIKKYFLSCALTHAQVKQNVNNISTIPQLIVTFQCGYCPKGLFGTLITYLINNEMQSDFEWELNTDKIYRDEVCFQVGPYDTVTIRFLPIHLEITCVKCNPDLSRSNCTEESVCQEVCQSVENGIKTVTSAINYINAQHSFTFYCTSGSEECRRDPHPAKLMKFKGKLCNLKCDKVKNCFPLPSGFEKWQLDSSPQTFEPTTEVCHDPKVKLDKRHCSSLISQLSNCAAKWREIGTHLEFQQGELSNIQAKPLLLSGAPQSWLSDLLSQWMERAPRDSHGSTKYATLEDLKSAVSKAGFGVVAARLSCQLLHDSWK